jgi:hypothetical protein
MCNQQETLVLKVAMHIKVFITSVEVEVCTVSEATELVDPPGDEACAARPRLTRSRSAFAAAARAAATRLKTCFRPAATMASPENRPDRTDGATHGGGSDPDLLLRPSFVRVCG